MGGGGGGGEAYIDHPMYEIKENLIYWFIQGTRR